MRGRWTFVFFGFVNCPDVCPTTLATLAAVRNSLADLAEPYRPRVVLVSVDPARDTPAVLAQYVLHFDPSFVGVTGSPAALDTLTRALGVAVIVGPADAAGNYSVDHTAAVFLVDPEAPRRGSLQHAARRRGDRARLPPHRRGTMKAPCRTAVA